MVSDLLLGYGLIQIIGTHVTILARSACNYYPPTFFERIEERLSKKRTLKTLNYKHNKVIKSFNDLNVTSTCDYLRSTLHLEWQTFIDLNAYSRTYFGTYQNDTASTIAPSSITQRTPQSSIRKKSSSTEMFKSIPRGSLEASPLESTSVPKSNKPVANCQRPCEWDLFVTQYGAVRLKLLKDTSAYEVVLFSNT